MIKKEVAQAASFLLCKNLVFIDREMKSQHEFASRQKKALLGEMCKKMFDTIG